MIMCVLIAAVGPAVAAAAVEIEKVTVLVQVLMAPKMV